MNTIPSKADTALLVIDIQNDFMEGGSLAISSASDILPFVNERICSGDYGLIVATQDMHPEDHIGFKVWPVHCVQFTKGAQLHTGLAQDRIDVLWRKGMDPSVDSYGAFKDNEGKPSALADLLKGRGIRSVEILGLATDYCVGNTALQAASLFKTRVLLDGCKGVGLTPEDIPAMLEKLRSAGVELVGG